MGIRLRDELEVLLERLQKELDQRLARIASVVAAIEQRIRVFMVPPG